MIAVICKKPLVYQLHTTLYLGSGMVFENRVDTTESRNDGVYLRLH
jgi:hypothetical protein